MSKWRTSNSIERTNNNIINPNQTKFNIGKEYQQYNQNKTMKSSITLRPNDYERQSPKNNASAQKKMRWSKTDYDDESRSQKNFLKSPHDSESQNNNEKPNDYMDDLQNNKKRFLINDISLNEKSTQDKVLQQNHTQRTLKTSNSSENTHQEIGQVEDKMNQLNSIESTNKLNKYSNTGRYSKMSEEEAASAFENRKKELLSTLLLKNNDEKRPNSTTKVQFDNKTNKNTQSEIKSIPAFNSEGKPNMNNFIIFSNSTKNSNSPPPFKKDYIGYNNNNNNHHSIDNLKQKSPTSRSSTTSQNFNKMKHLEEVEPNCSFNSSITPKHSDSISLKSSLLIMKNKNDSMSSQRKYEIKTETDMIIPNNYASIHGPFSLKYLTPRTEDYSLRDKSKKTDKLHAKSLQGMNSQDGDDGESIRDKSKEIKNKQNKIDEYSNYSHMSSQSLRLTKNDSTTSGFKYKSQEEEHQPQRSDQNNKNGSINGSMSGSGNTPKSMANLEKHFIKMKENTPIEKNSNLLNNYGNQSYAQIMMAKKSYKKTHLSEDLNNNNMFSQVCNVKPQKQDHLEDLPDKTSLPTSSQAHSVIKDNSVDKVSSKNKKESELKIQMREEEEGQEIIDRNLYKALSEQNFSSRGEYLFARAMVQKEAKKWIINKHQNQKERENLKECTFAPNIITENSFKTENIIDKTKKWQQQMKIQEIENERMKLQKELEGCKFYPNDMLKRNPEAKFDANEFYKRNVEWMKRKEAITIKKQNDILSTLLNTDKSPKSAHTLTSFSKMESSPHNKSSILEINNNPRHIKNHDSTSFTNPNHLTRNKSHSLERQGKSNNSLTKLIRPEPKKIIEESKKFLNSQNNPTAKKGNMNQNLDLEPAIIQNPKALKNHILQSYALLDSIQNIMSTQQDKLTDTNGDLEFSMTKRMTTSNDQSYDYEKVKSTKNLYKANTVISPISNCRFDDGKEAPMLTTLSEFDKNNVKKIPQQIVIKNNRYFIEDNKNKSDAETSISFSINDNKSSIDTTKYIPSSRVQMPQQQQQQYQKQERHLENGYKSMGNFENMNHKYINSDNYRYRNNSNGSVESIKTTAVANPSKSQILNRNNNNNTLENKYLELINHLSRVTNQIENDNIANQKRLSNPKLLAYPN